MVETRRGFLPGPGSRKYFVEMSIERPSIVRHCALCRGQRRAQVLRQRLPWLQCSQSVGVDGRGHSLGSAALRERRLAEQRDEIARLQRQRALERLGFFIDALELSLCRSQVDVQRCGFFVASKGALEQHLGLL